MSEQTLPVEVAAIENHYQSVDSAPARYSVSRPPSATNGFMITFTALTVVVMCAMMFLIHAGFIDDRRDLMILSRRHSNVAVPTRMFVIIFFITYAAYATGNLWRKLWIGFELVTKLIVVSAIVDVIAWALSIRHILEISAFGQQIASALLALCILPHTIMRQAQLPDAVVNARHPRTPFNAYVRLFIPLTVALILAAYLEQRYSPFIDNLKAWSILGGVGPGVFLAQQLFAAFTAVVGWWIVRRSRRARFAPRLAVLVPAHNEAHGIAETIESVDRAAQSYKGDVHIYVVDNASSDTTFEVAAQTIAQCRWITGVALKCEAPGKAIALNYGLAQISEDFVCRIDADTIIGAGCLDIAMRHFAKPRVGAVGGMPLPTEERTWIDKARLIEVLLRHGFFQISQVGYQGVLGVPGMFAIYRRCGLLEVGGFVQGMNGEDTDICLRMDNVGYYTLADPTAIYYSETPATYAHLREQRVRWFRSIYHITAHNRGVVLDRKSMTGALVLPFMLANAARRAMLAPLLIFAFFAEIIFRNTFTTLHWQPVLATVLGMPMVMAILICLLWRRPDAIRYLPLYLFFRLLRSYFTLSAALSLVYPPLHPREALPERFRRAPAAVAAQQDPPAGHAR